MEIYGPGGAGNPTSASAPSSPPDIRYDDVPDDPHGEIEQREALEAAREGKMRRPSSMRNLFDETAWSYHPDVMGTEDEKEELERPRPAGFRND